MLERLEHHHTALEPADTVIMPYTAVDEPEETPVDLPEPRRTPVASRLWAGGAATALVAGLIAITGILVARGILDVAVLAPKGAGVWGDANTTTYALVAAACAFGATGLAQALLGTTPDALRFFTRIALLITAITAVLPLSLDVDAASHVVTAVLNACIGIAITVSLRGVVRRSTT
jgi:Family of unknown function (DUF6069)